MFDVRNNVVETYVGTNDSGATDEQPDGFNVPGNNMVKTATSIFDNANPVGGNNLLTTAVEHVNSNPDNDRRTDFAHDFRNRNYLTTAFISTIGTPVSVVTLKTFDNLDGVTGVAQYNTTVGTGHLIRKSATLHRQPPPRLPDAGLRCQRRHDQRNHALRQHLVQRPWPTGQAGPGRRLARVHQDGVRCR